VSDQVDVEALMRAAAADALNAQAALAQERTEQRAPKDTRELAESFDVDQASPGDLEALLYSDSPYSRYQHEALYLEHPAGGQPKFMESAVVGGDSARVLAQTAAAAARRALGG
jgi:hypothetical protein